MIVLGQKESLWFCYQGCAGGIRCNEKSQWNLDAEELKQIGENPSSCRSKNRNLERSTWSLSGYLLSLELILSFNTWIMNYSLKEMFNLNFKYHCKDNLFYKGYIPPKKGKARYYFVLQTVLQFQRIINSLKQFS